MKVYRIFDIAMACDFVVPGLAELQQQDYDWHLSLAVDVFGTSAVELSNGCAVAFTGHSGQGKSTLATAFFSAGHRLVTDDCHLLEKRAGALYAMSPYPSLRLWPDSARALAGKKMQTFPNFPKWRTTATSNNCSWKRVTLV